jgi:hypothetical protein
MEINTFKINVTYFTRKTNSIHFIYNVGDLLIVRTDWVKYL